ncbi:hypothetical protein PINS_up015032 [Pythium insidiosum]|nr:hypothetical protein PINS_up015032 [Pythium insidiosum]
MEAVASETPTDLALQRIAQSQRSQQLAVKPEHVPVPLSVGSHLSDSAAPMLSTLGDASSSRLRAQHESSSLNCHCCREYGSERPAVSPVLKDQWVWERQHCGMMAHVKDLAIVLYFVSNTSMETLLQSFRLREHVFAALRLHWSSLFVAAASSNTSGSSLGSAGLGGSNGRSERLLLSVSKLCIWAMGDENLSIIRDFFEVHNVVLLDKPKLRDAFLHWIALIYKRIQSFCVREFASDPSSARADIDSTQHRNSQSRDLAVRTIRAISEHIIAMIHSDTKLQATWPAVREILEQPGVLLWEAFVAQLRETYTRQQRSAALMGLPDLPRCPSRSLLNGRWALDASSVVVEPLSSDRFAKSQITSGLSMLSCLLAMLQLLRMELEFDESGLLRVRSQQNVYSTDDAWMTLVCDDEPRVASVLPMGLTSLLGSSAFAVTTEPASTRISHAFVLRCSGGRDVLASTDGITKRWSPQERRV